MEMTKAAEERPSLVTGAVLHRWPWIAVLAILLGAGGYAAGHSLAPTYTATTEVLLNPTVGNALSPDSIKSGPQITIAMNTEAALITSPALLDTAAKAAKVSEPDPTDVAVKVPANTQIVSVSFTGSSEATAIAASTALSKAFLDFRQAQSKSLIDQQLAGLAKQADSVDAALKQAQSDSSVSQPTADAIARLQLYSNRFAEIQGQRDQLVSAPTNPGYVIAPAMTALSEKIPAAVFGVVGLMLGGMLGFLIALGRERADDRLRVGRSPSIGSIPVLATQVVPSTTVLAADLGNQVRAALLAQTGEEGTIALAGLSSAVAASEVLAVARQTSEALARVGRSAVVVDALTQRHGGVMVPEPMSRVSQTVPTDDESPLVVVGTDDDRQIPSSHGFQTLVEELRSRYEIVLVVGPPPTQPEGVALSLVTDKLIGVVVDRATRLKDVTTAARAANRFGIRLLGVVVLPKQSSEKPRKSQATDAVGRPEDEGLIDSPTRAASR